MLLQVTVSLLPPVLPAKFVLLRMENHTSISSPRHLINTSLSVRTDTSSERLGMKRKLSLFLSSEIFYLSNEQKDYIFQVENHLYL